MSEIRAIHRKAMELAKLGIQAKDAGNIDAYIKYSTDAFYIEKKAALLLFPNIDAEPTRSVLFRSAATLAYNCGLMDEAEYLIHCALSGKPYNEIKNELKHLLVQIESSKVEVLSPEDVTEFSYLTVLREKAFSWKIEPKGVKHSRAILVDNIIDCLRNVKISFSNYVRINFDKAFKDAGFKDFDKALKDIITESRPLCVDLKWNSFGVSIASDTVVMSRLYSNEINNWKTQIFENYKQEVILPNYNTEQYIEHIASKYSNEERQEIFYNIAETFKDNSPYKVSLTDKNFGEIVRTYSPFSKQIREILVPPKSQEQEEEKKKLFRTIGFANPDSGVINKRNILESEQLDYAEFLGKTNSIKYEEKIIELKEQYEFKVVYDKGNFIISEYIFGIEVSANDYDNVVNKYFKEFIELYSKVIDPSYEVSIEEQGYRDQFEKLVFSRNWE